jgi:hypothetical protein
MKLLFIPLLFISVFYSCIQKTSEQKTDEENIANENNKAIFHLTEINVIAENVEDAPFPIMNFNGYIPSICMDSLIWATAQIDSTKHDFYCEIQNRTANLFFAELNKSEQLQKSTKLLEHVERHIEDNITPMNNCVPNLYEYVMFNLLYCYLKAGRWDEAHNKLIKLRIYEKDPSEGSITVSFMSSVLLYKQENKYPFKIGLPIIPFLQNIRYQYELMKMKDTQEWQNCVDIIRQLNQI